jgi:hypothetical protein
MRQSGSKIEFTSLPRGIRKRLDTCRRPMPAALTLRHAPIADCARYDNLRRIGGPSPTPIDRGAADPGRRRVHRRRFPCATSRYRKLRIFVRKSGASASSARPPCGSRRARRSGAQGSGGRSISRSAGRQDGRFRGRAGTARRTQEARRRGRHGNDRRPGRARPGRGPLGDRSDLSRTRCGHPSLRSSAALRASRCTLRSNLAVQYSMLEVGVVALPQPCLCQKQP